MTTVSYEDLKPGKAMQVEVDGKPVCVARVGDEVFAVSNICSHSYAELSEGEISGYEIECWLHGAQFDLRTGEPTSLPATESIETYAVARSGNEISITTIKRES